MPNNQNCANQIQCFQEVVEQAIASFNEKEMYLIENDVSERCICARFAIHLTDALKYTLYNDYLVDVEYNRGNEGNQRSPKRMDGQPITVDLIVHKRGYDCNYGFDNLICIEVKKSTDRRSCTDDERRLQKMVSYEYGFCYKAGFMILINMRKHHLGLEIKKSFFLQ